MKMISRFAGLLGCLLLASPVFSQQIGGSAPDPKMLPGGGSSASGMSGIYSPSLYDGSLNVNIPIYQYSTSGLNLGVALTYNTRGVKVDEQSSAAGLHWNIAAEGSIQRIVKGFADELNETADSIYLAGTQYYTRIKGRLSCSFENSAQAADNATLRDEESDDFLVSVGGLSFTFNIGKQRAILVRPVRGVQVEVMYNGLPIADAIPAGGSITDPLALSFRIIDEQGNRYYFQKADWLQDRLSTKLESANIVYSGFYDYITRWAVQKIVLANGQEVNYSYSTVYSNLVQYKSSYLRESLLPGIYSTMITTGDVTSAGYVSDIASISYPNGTLVSFKYETDPAKARCDARNAFGSTSPGYMALREIAVSEGSNCLRYRLKQSYEVVKMWNNTTIDSLPYGSPCMDLHSNYGPSLPEEHIPFHRSHRLRLDGISLVSCDGTTEEPFYTFSYDATRLPLRFRGSQDFFGYYNGANPLYEPDGLVPRHLSVALSSAPGTMHGQDRNPSLTHMKASVLKEVRNAQGGRVSFGYELNDGLQSVMGGLPLADSFYLGEDVADGLRLASIAETDNYNAGNSRLTTFQYGGGQFFLNGGYFHSGELYDDSGTTDNIRIYSMGGHFLTPHHFVNGANHGYSYVTVYNKALQGSTLSALSTKSVTFSNFSDATSGNQPRYLKVGPGSKDFFRFPYTDKPYLKDWEMGLPLETVEFDENNRKVMETFNEYTFLADTVSSVTAGVENKKVCYVDYNFAPTIYTGAPDFYSWKSKRVFTDSYRPFSGRALLQRSTVRKYVTDSRYIADTSQYEYDSRGNLKKILTRSSTGEQTETINYYNYDLATAVPGSFWIPLPGLELVLGTQRWQRPGSVSGSAPLPDNGQLVDAYFTGYSWQMNGGRPEKIWNKRLYNLYTEGAPAYSEYLGTGAYNTTALKAWAASEGQPLPLFDKTSEVVAFDAKGNPLETWVSGDVRKAMLWDTATGRKVAEAASCRYTDIAYSSFEETTPPLTSQVTMGRFTYATAGLADNAGIGAPPVTGGKVYRLRAGTGATSLSGMPLTAGRSYRLSFWVKGTVLPVMTAGGSSILLSSAHITATKGSWTQYQVTFTPGSTTGLSMSSAGADIYIDEVRLCPADARMTTGTFLPLFGPGSSTDPSGRITYYEYDKLGRQTIVRDQDGNILSKTEQVLQGQD